jgi:hypothetical protein
MKTTKNNQVSAFDLMYAKDCNTGYQSASMDAMECQNDDISEYYENVIHNGSTLQELYNQIYFQVNEMRFLPDPKPNFMGTKEQYINSNKKFFRDMFFGLDNLENRLLNENFPLDAFNVLNLQQRKKVCKIVLDAWRNEQKQTVNKYLYNAIRFYKLV